MELTSLSRNWKRLEQKLQAEKKANPKSSPPKKTPEQGLKNGVKRQRYRTAFTSVPNKRQRMDEGKAQHEAARLPEHIVSPPQHDAVLINCGFVPDAEAGKFVALDCEMVGIGPEPDKDSQLARVSITNYNGDLLYDSYVLPVLPVTDYRTFVSGIKPAHLQKGVARPFKRVQEDVSSLLDGRILVGHSLKNDFDALILTHPRRDVRDTSKLPKYREFAAGRNPSLKKLAREVLGLDIQGGEHSSIEDAKVTMLLFRHEKDEFEREHRRKWGNTSLPKPKVVMGEQENDASVNNRTPQAIARHKRLAKKKAKKR